MSQQTVHLDDLESLVGTPIGPTEWHDMDQRMVDGFADVTGDHQWIHTDPERAARGPFGSTIAHGFFTLSLAPVLSWELLTVEGVSMAVNYGLNKVPVGTAVRGTMTLVELTEVQGGLQSVSELTVERDGGTKPVCVAELVTRYYR